MSKYDDPIPGWILPAPWALNDGEVAEEGGSTGGPRNFGWLILRYTSTGDGCIPVMTLRRNLRRRVLAGMKRIV